MSDGWLYLENDEINGSTRVPDNPGVRGWYEARGWRVVDAPDETARFTPAPDAGDPVAEWVELVHPELEARHTFPSNPDAVAGAREAGWVEPNKDGSIPKRARTTSAKTSAATTAAASTSDRPDTTATEPKE